MGIAKFNIFPRIQRNYISRPHLIFIRVIACLLVFSFRSHFLYGKFLRTRICFYESGKKTFHQSRRQFTFRISARLQDRFNNLCQIGNAPVLFRSFRIHDVQYIRHPCLLPISGNSGIFRFFQRNFMGMPVSEMIGNHHPIPVHFHPVINHIAAILYLHDVKQACALRRGAPVRFDYMKP